MNVYKQGENWYLGSPGHAFGVQGVNPVWWRQWTGIGGRGAGPDSYQKHYPEGMAAWVENQAELVIRSGAKLVTQWTDFNLAIQLVNEGLFWVPVLMPNAETRRWVEDGADVDVGIQRVKAAALSLKRKIIDRGYDPQQVLTGIIDWQEPIWDCLRYGVLTGEEALRVAELLFPRCAQILRDIFPGVPVWSPKIAGSVEKTHNQSGWIGFEGDEIGGESYIWKYLRYATIDREVLCVNCYGDREKHRLSDMHQWTQRPILITEFSHWILDRETNFGRWLDFKLGRKQPRFTHVSSTQESVEAIRKDLLYDSTTPYIIGSVIYLWSYHAWDWGWGPNQYLFGYLGHAVDPTRTDPDTGREWRNYAWLDGVRSACKAADAVHSQATSGRLNVY